jgi:hypothetical protein
MSRLNPEKLLVLNRAAELRAGGSSWPTVATELKVAADELRSLRAANARAYDRLERRADNEFKRETVRASLARLRELLKSESEGLAMAAAGTIIRYELARMRHDERRELRKAEPKFRNELPPPPSRAVTAEKSRCDGGCDSVSTATQMPNQTAVTAEQATPAAAQTSRRDSVPTSGVTGGVTASKPTGKTTMMDAIRRKKWMPRGLAR